MNINQLCDRYSLKSRQSIYDWCKALKVKLSRDDDNKSYAPPELIELFDQLAEHRTYALTDQFNYETT
jgi:hypothetical protein